MGSDAPNHKKRRRSNDPRSAPLPDTSKPSARFTAPATGGRAYTLSIAVPGSIIANAQTHDLKTSLAGQIGRACAVFCVDEVIVYNDQEQQDSPSDDSEAYTAFSDPTTFLARVLAYLETPPHLRRALWSLHPDLRSAGALPSLDMPHHMRAGEGEMGFREGVAEKKGKKGRLVEVGLERKVAVQEEVEEGARVTVALRGEDGAGELRGEAVAPEAPRERDGYYWGFAVRRAGSLGAVVTECGFDGGYDVSIGTSERGQPVERLTRSDNGVPEEWKHLLVVFGGVAGLEAAFAADRELHAAGVERVEELFDYWIDLVPGQGSRTIRTEEAVWIGLMGLRCLVDARSER